MVFLKNAAIVGGTGYGALELLRFLEGHPHIQLKQIISQSQDGKQLNDLYPHLTTFIEEPMSTFDFSKIKQDIEIVFFATPAGITKGLITQFAETSIQCIDLSGDLRLTDRQDYQDWYGAEAAPQHILNKAVYGLSEIYQDELKGSTICSNPGCFSTASLLGLIPAVHHQLIDTESIIIDGKTGVSGAGRKQSIMTHFSETNENVKPYKIGQHQHIPEIEQYLTKEAKKPALINMTTHLIPMTRGLLCTMYGKLTSNISSKEIHNIYEEYYRSHPFVRVRPIGTFPTTKEVYGSNFCDIGLYLNERTNQLVIISTIDNLVKGAAGQAIQNANIMNEWPIETGLKQIPIYP